MTERISAEEALQRMGDDGWVYVDVRAVQQFEQGHPQGAYNIPILEIGPSGMQPNADFVAQVQRAFPDKGTKMILGCRSGGRSLRAATLLRQAGYTAVVDQRAGFGGSRDPFGATIEQGWQELGLPASTQAEPGRSFAELKAAS